MLSIGIVGLPNVGKSTLFNALTKNNVLAANYPFATIEPNTGVVAVPDSRLEVLASISNSEKITPASIKFVDIAGLVEGAHKGEGMGNAFLSHIRETNAIAQIVRAFEDKDIQHVNQVVDPQRDIETINTELILADLATISSHLPKLEKQLKGDKSVAKKIETLNSLSKELNSGKLAIDTELDLEEVRYLNLLTAKPFIYVFNLDENNINNDKLKAKLTTIAPSKNIVFVSAKIEQEISELDQEEAKIFMSEYGLVESGLERLSRVGYETLHLQSYLTTGPKETRAWTIKQGATAPQAAGVIHGDFERGFIAADVVSYQDLVDAGSWANARSKGKVRTEGKDYVMQPDDVVEFKFNV